MLWVVAENTNNGSLLHSIIAIWLICEILLILPHPCFILVTLRKHYKCLAHICKREDDKSHKKDITNKVEHPVLKNVFHAANEEQQCKGIMNLILSNDELLYNKFNP